MFYNISNITIFGNHGLYDYEKENGQNFHIDVSYNTKINTKITDDITDFIDYSAIVNEVKIIFNSRRYNLIEKLAFDIHSHIKKKYKNIYDLEVVIKKRNPLKVEKVDEIIFKYRK